VQPYQPRFEPGEYRELPDVLERVIDRTLLWLALVLVEISLKLPFCFLSVDYKFPPRPERQFANIAIGGVRSAPNESDDSEPAVRHDSIIAGRGYGVNCLGRVTAGRKLSCVMTITAILIAFPLACGGFTWHPVKDLNCSPHLAGCKPVGRQVAKQTIGAKDVCFFHVFLSRKLFLSLTCQPRRKKIT
jgi:hypothetical protein